MKTRFDRCTVLREHGRNRARLPKRVGRRSGAAALSLACLTGGPAAGAATLSAGEPADSFDMKTFVFDLQQPTDIAVLRDGRAVVTQRLGDVAVVEADGTVVQAGHIDVNPLHGEQGLLGVVADPEFSQNHALYFYASAGTDVANKHKVYKITLADDGKLDSGRTLIIDKGLQGPKNHNGGGLVIHDGQLYVSVGDTGHNATPPTNKNGTCLNVPNGKILRVNLDGSVPADNPLVGMAQVTGCATYDADFEMLPPDERIYAWGFRNPWRFWIDPMTDRLWVGDVGEVTREEIDVGRGAEHFGWPFFEGTVEYSQSWKPGNACQGVTPPAECVPPIYDYPHASGNNCVVGGLIPSGCGWPDVWKSRYFFGDHGSGRVWTLDVTADRQGMVADSVKDFASTAGVASFRMGPDHALYIVEVDGGSVQRVLPKGFDAGACPPDGTEQPDASVIDDGGAGGAGAAGNDGAAAAGNGDAMGAGGAAGAGTGGTAGAGTGGAAGSGNAGAAAAGGSVASGGASGAPGAGAAPGSGAQSDDGGPEARSGDSSSCGCRLETRPRGAGSGAALLAALAAFAIRRRRSGGA